MSNKVREAVENIASKQLDAISYLKKIETLAKNIITKALDENTFEVFLPDGDKTDLQKAISDLAQELRYTHYKNDGCVDHD
jgi:hypothetical protein